MRATTTTVALAEGRAGGFVPSAQRAMRTLLVQVRRALSAVSTPVAIAGFMFLGIFAARLLVQAPDSPAIVLLFMAPVVLISVTRGAAAGFASATLAVTLAALSAEVRGVQPEPIDFVARAFAFYAIPLTIWLGRLEAQEVAPSVKEASATRTSYALTRREREILALLAAGHTNAEMAEKLVLSVRTIESHRASLRRKLGPHSREELVQKALRSGLLPASERPYSDVVHDPQRQS